MNRFAKNILNFILIFSLITLTFFSVLIFVIRYEGIDEDTILAYEGFVFCSLFYAYLGLRFIRKVIKINMTFFKKALIGIAFFLAGFFVTRIFPVHVIAGICDAAGYYLFNIEIETNTQILLIWFICSVAFALICYESAEKYYIEVKKSKSEDSGEK